MDRRGFLKALGVSGALVMAAPQVVLAATTKVAVPERRVFLPPLDGWLTTSENVHWLAWKGDESALDYLKRVGYISPRAQLNNPDRDGGFLVPRDMAQAVLEIAARGGVWRELNETVDPSLGSRLIRLRPLPADARFIRAKISTGSSPGIATIAY